MKVPVVRRYKYPFFSALFNVNFPPAGIEQLKVEKMR